MARRRRTTPKGDPEVGARIREARDEAGLGQQALAELAGLKRADEISRYERGSNPIPPPRLIAIARALQQPLSRFDPALEDTVPPPLEPSSASRLEQAVRGDSASPARRLDSMDRRIGVIEEAVLNLGEGQEGLAVGMRSVLAAVEQLLAVVEQQASRDQPARRTRG